MMRKENPLVYIIVLNWNGGPDTIECLLSLERQSYKRYEIVVVDNGSTDDSVFRIREAFPKVKLIETGKNLGFSAGCNVGIRFAIEYNAKFVWLLNNDTKVCEQTLAEMVKVAVNDKNAGAVGAVIVDMEAPDRIQAWGGGTVLFWCGCSRNAIASTDLDYLTAASLLVPSTVFEKVGYFDERYFLYWEDVDFSYRVKKAGFSLVVSEKAKVLHKKASSLRHYSPLLDSYVSYSLTRFMLDHSPMTSLSITIGLLTKILRRVAYLHFLNVIAICNGARRAMVSPRDNKVM